jgi:hypothetical protein
MTRALPSAWQRALHLHLVAIVRGEKVRADQQQDQVSALQLLVDALAQRIARGDAPVMPGGNRARALERRQLHLKLVAQGFVVVRVGKEHMAGSPNSLCMPASAIANSPQLKAFNIKEIEALLKFDQINAVSRPGNTSVSA